ncbi:COG3650 family protein [Aestuariibaculum suncheonense]|uniref:Lipoprotein n=1 Tax=Aestuariibaculum suncheonense TaxID=1028745 RepID=A0A8J6Q4W9_9FLAO|nr:hypothetical protein [Aestuariibaculum suncheonense]MBD0835133.1 hypothetical protein [Aestuariibaculum suncheonense]
MRGLIFSIALISVFFIACKNQNAKTSEVVEAESGENLDIETAEIPSSEVLLGTYFKASGTEPFWGMDIADNKIELKTMSDTIITPHVEPVRAMDANLKRYRVVTEAVVLTVQISKNNCTNAMSGEVFPYSVTIDYKYTGEENMHKLEGCGYYTTHLETGCYAYNNNGNALLFQVTDVSHEVYGRLKYSYHEKDENIGNFRGRLYRDKLLGTFSFISEGIESVREVAFLVKQDTLIEGFGALDETGTAFKFRDSIEFTSKTPMVKTDCK